MQQDTDLHASASINSLVPGGSGHSGPRPANQPEAQADSVPTVSKPKGANFFILYRSLAYNEVVKRPSTSSFRQQNNGSGTDSSVFAMGASPIVIPM